MSSDQQQQQPSVVMYGFSTSYTCDQNTDHEKFLYQIARVPERDKVTELNMGGDLTSDYPRWCCIDDATLALIPSTFPNLTSLNIDMSESISDAGLSCLAKLSKLKSLGMVNCTTITDAGLEHVSSIATLEWVDVTYCGVTAQGKAKLQETLPNCKIQSA